jgi:hypothetical protein
MLSDEEGTRGQPLPLVVLVDSNAFGRRAWIQTLVDAALAGCILLYWSPTIIEEMARMRQLIWIRNWLRQGGTTFTEGVRRRFSEEAHRWMDFIGPHFHVVEDKPPFAPAWVDQMPDPYDAPIWTAARRAQATVIVTQNLKDGPPKYEHGVQVFADVLYLDPADLPAFLMWWGDYYASGGLGSSETSWNPTTDGDPDRTASDVASDSALSPAIRELILDLQRRRVGAGVTNEVPVDRGQ